MTCRRWQRASNRIENDNGVSPRAGRQKDRDVREAKITLDGVGVWRGEKFDSPGIQESAGPVCSRNSLESAMDEIYEKSFRRRDNENFSLLFTHRLLFPMDDWPNEIEIVFPSPRPFRTFWPSVANRLRDENFSRPSYPLTKRDSVISKVRTFSLSRTDLRFQPISKAPPRCDRFQSNLRISHGKTRDRLLLVSWSTNYQPKEAQGGGEAFFQKLGQLDKCN